jgi:predicted DNA-binding WGR domain protein
MSDTSAVSDDEDPFAMATIFGDWSVMREWGRRGSPGTVRLSSYQRRTEAETAEQQIVKRRRRFRYRPFDGGS